MSVRSALIAVSPILVALTTARNILPSPSDNPISYVLGQHDNSDLPALVNREAGGRCGPSFGKCPNGHCCSTAGYCGNTQNHCRSPDCQIDYGHCDAHKTPGGAPTDAVPRPQLGHVAYGPHAVRSCSVPGTVALTYDDGPGPYTNDLLDLLDKYDAKATFFITGNNNGKGEIDAPGKPWVEMIQRMRWKGHQIASHTWSHQDLSKISKDQRRVQLLWNEVALRNILGGFPTYMRPPYSSCTPESGCLKDMGSLGYHVVLYDIDTEDYRYDSPTMIQRSKDIFDKNLARRKPSDMSWLVIAHDVHEQTVHNLTEHMLKKIRSDGYRPVTVGECLGDPGDFWYRTDDNFDNNLLMRMSSEVTEGKIVSQDGVCGNGITCTGSTFGPCCSKTNRCGSYTTHCGEGCQPDSGKCNGVPESAPGSDNSAHGHRILSDIGKTALKSEASSWSDPYSTGLVLFAVVLALWI